MQRAHPGPSKQARTQNRWLGLGTVKAPDFAGTQSQFFNGYVSEQDPLLNGHIKAVQVHPDLWLHAVEGCDLRTFTSKSPAQQGLHIVIVLEGSVDVAFGGLPLQLPQPCSEVSTEAGAAAAPKSRLPHASGALVNTCKHEIFVRNWRMGKFERKLSLRVHPRLLQSLACTTGYTHLQSMLEQHLYVQLWKPSARAVVLAEQIIHLIGQENATLLLQSRTLEFLHEAVQPQKQNDPEDSSRPALHLRNHLRMAKLKAMLDAQQDGGAMVADLARDMGMSPSALQRQFRQLYGSSIDEYRRSQRLDHARALLAQTGCSVQEVAHSSGYTSAANFSTAFKRRFGISPKLVRSRF
ncbi:helix-turn-helix transcriptional regulator [Comamonas sp. Y33R10-2]|uniref:helix-turn-helix transcriptional regulator n=1 Tax=Comamonas sp. Y33R10-2 TaxID=2853257 RepID=UPI001C5CB601|nr:AraC family transcriptional regulator [Comamonas sp. Y33R10-2]QXZ10301.1 helix-turn-helix transcriptional regulator [Comamonas sp. Y33R10-2]